jgi:hypothetical protein|tara:strand:+ start:1712 stop:2335 length:624 start_codon:yes stop_codon:yes gene_type:complete
MSNLNILLISLCGFIFSVCPEGFYEDDCGNCWLPYCYNYVSHEVSYDVDENECLGGTLIWVVPGDQGDPYFNSYCDFCPNGFYGDDCGHCWMPFCYTFFSPGLDGDPTHSVYYDLSQIECEGLGYGYYEPGHPADPYFNSNCDDSDNGGCASGDQNEDGNIDVLDVVAIVAIIVSVSQEYSECGDFNADSSLDVLDVVAIVNQIISE